MSLPRVTHLRHIGVAAPNFAEASDFYENAWGLKKVEQEGGIAFFAAEGSPEQYILRIRADKDKRVDLIAFGAESAEAVDALAQELAAAGVRFASEPDTLQTHGGGYGFRFFDPDGRVVEISSGVEERPYRQLEPRESIPVKLSHVVVSSPNIDETTAFYQERLGLKLSDWIEDRMCFMRATPDHHSLAIFRGEGAQLNHVAFEFRGIDEFMRATGRVLAAGGTLRNGPGRHVIGDNTFSYFYDPNGNVSEITTGMEQVPLEGGREPGRVTQAQAADQWKVGSERADAVPEAALTRETGQWVAPPV